jgi:hypothetical protein
MRVGNGFMQEEIKILSQGAFYMTPFREHHIQEFLKVIHHETLIELYNLGYKSITEALQNVVDTSEAYIVKDKRGVILLVCGLVHDDETPQMFALFTTNLKNNYKGLVRSSKSLVNFFDQMHPMLTMTISAKYGDMLQWAAWLGFKAVGISEHKNITYVEFVRCNSVKNYVSHETSRPVMH